MDWTGWKLALCAAGLALAQPAAADALEQALALPVAGGLVGAQDKPRFAWVENKAGVRNIWIADKSQPARAITAFKDDDGLPIYDLEFTRDGGTLAFVRGGDPEYPDEEDAPNAAGLAAWPRQQLFVTALDGSAATLIGEGHAPVFSPQGDRLAFTRRGSLYLWQRGGEARRVAKVAGEVGNLQWSPDGARLLFTDNRRGHSVVGLLDIGADQVRYVDAALGDAIEPVFSPDGQQIAFIFAVDPPAGAAPDSGPYWSLRIADAATGAARMLWAAPQGVGGRYAGTRGQNLFWSANGTIVFPWEASGWIHAYAIDPNGGGPRELTPGAFELDTYTLSPDGKNLVYAANAGDLDRHHVWRVPLRGGAPEALTKGDGIESYPLFGGDTLAVTATDATHPAFPALAGRKLTPIGAAPAASGFVTPQPVVFKAEDGVEVHAQLFRAKGAGRHPALIFVHGGPRRQTLLGFHPSGYYSNAYILNQHFAAEGYDVLSVNYRSGTGYGRTFRDAPAIAREGASEYRDVLAGGRWLGAQSFVDPARIGIWGGSWGGYLTALALARNSDLFAAGVDFHGVHAMVRPVENNLSPDQQAAAQRLQWSSSPMGSIDSWRSPVLLIHGDDDKNVDFGQSILLARELAARRIPYRDLVFPNERHGFLRYADWLTSYCATDAFFREMLMEKKAR
ncbi:S9 family peptidase [Sphingomonas crusticola]|uniref:S9 family peptidase n=1 Tax=Sphingomonas crusticola TaxID=1697973 RepID=UPI000E24BB4E|nr:prolyl oligopeptidase family serine peptidase [Sphingomonas crusticola]